MSSFLIFFNATATPEIYTLSLHDALPICWCAERCSASMLHTAPPARGASRRDRKSTRLNSSHVAISYAVFCLKKKNRQHSPTAEDTNWTTVSDQLRTVLLR